MLAADTKGLFTGRLCTLSIHVITLEKSVSGKKPKTLWRKVYTKIQQQQHTLSSLQRYVPRMLKAMFPGSRVGWTTHIARTAGATTVLICM